MEETADPRLHQIWIAPTRSVPMQQRRRVMADPGRGLVGDRYHAGEGTFSGRYAVKPGVREVSLIYVQAIAECSQRLDVEVSAADLRRNLVLAGMPDRDLRGSILRIEGVELEILSRCPPCGYLSRLLNLDMRRGLAYIGGMRARILTAGVLTEGAAVSIESALDDGRPIEQR